MIAALAWAALALIAALALAFFVSGPEWQWQALLVASSWTLMVAGTIRRWPRGGYAANMRQILAVLAVGFALAVLAVAIRLGAWLHKGATVEMLAAGLVRLGIADEGGSLELALPTASSSARPSR